MAVTLNSYSPTQLVYRVLVGSLQVSELTPDHPARNAAKLQINGIKFIATVSALKLVSSGIVLESVTITGAQAKAYIAEPMSVSALAFRELLISAMGNIQGEWSKSFAEPKAIEAVIISGLMDAPTPSSTISKLKEQNPDAPSFLKPANQGKAKSKVMAKAEKVDLTAPNAKSDPLTVAMAGDPGAAAPPPVIGGALSSGVQVVAPKEAAHMKKVPLAGATMLYQPVSGTSKDSTYYTVALSKTLKVAAKCKDGNLSIRIEGDLAKYKKEIVNALDGQGLKSNYASIHLAVNEMTGPRALGAVLMALDVPFEAVGKFSILKVMP